jgi:phage tail-like protein
MRAAVRGLESRYPLGTMLPALYAADDFAQRFTAGLDVVLAPILATLDNFACYLEPTLAPEDFLDWLGGWVAADVDPDAPGPRRREAVARAVEFHRWRGTRRGLAEYLRLRFGVEPEIEESGGAAWSTTPGTEPPGSPEPFLLVRLRDAGPTTRTEDIEAAVATCVPAHVRYRIEMLPAPDGVNGP